MEKLDPQILFWKMKIEYIFGSIVLTVLYSLFLLYTKLRAIETYWN